VISCLPCQPATNPSLFRRAQPDWFILPNPLFQIHVRENEVWGLNGVLTWGELVNHFGRRRLLPNHMCLKRGHGKACERASRSHPCNGIQLSMSANAFHRRENWSRTRLLLNSGICKLYQLERRVTIIRSLPPFSVAPFDCRPSELQGKLVHLVNFKLKACLGR
jgi:hypothetical protein